MGDSDALHGDNRNKSADTRRQPRVSGRSRASDSAGHGLTRYRVLVACGDDKTGQTYKPGDIVTEKDFSNAVIANWLTIDPPVLEEVD